MKVAVYGSGLDSLICCIKLIDQGHTVEHFTSGNKLAGHFSGAVTDHGSFDLGMVLLERDMRSIPQKEITKYNGEYGVETRPFLMQAFELLENQVGLIQRRKMLTLLDSSREINDYFIADSLDFIDELSNLEKSFLQSRLSSLITEKPSMLIHPSKKNEVLQREKDELTFQLELVYGEKIARKLFGQFIEALTGSGTARIAVKFHRKLWIPLYFPETLLARIQSSDKSLTQLSFHEFTTGSVSTKIGELIRRLTNNDRYHENNTKYEELLISENYDELVFLLNVNDASKLLKSENVQKISSTINEKMFQTKPNEINILHLCIKEAENRTVTLQSPISGLFRFSISNGIEKGKSNLSAEFGNLSGASLLNLTETIKTVIPNLQGSCKGKVFKMNFAVRYLNTSPDEWTYLSGNIRQEFSKFSKNFFIIHPDALSLNDNLVRGIAAAEKLGLQ